MSSAIQSPHRNASRPRKGAWIEIPGRPGGQPGKRGRPRKGAWIEIEKAQDALERIKSPPQGGVD